MLHFYVQISNGGVLRTFQGGDWEKIKKRVDGYLRDFNLEKRPKKYNPYVQ